MTNARRWEIAKERLAQAKVEFDAALLEHSQARTALLTDLGSDSKGVTARQLQVLALVREHWQNKEIAQELGIEVRTVKCHVAALTKKFGVDSRHKL